MDGWVEEMNEVFQYVDGLRQKISAEQAMGGNANSTWQVGLPIKLWRFQEPSLAASATVQRTNRKMRNQFASIILRPSNELDNFAPPYFIKIHKEFFSSENYQSFADFLTCRNTLGLMCMSLPFPNNGGSMNFIFGSSLSFPEMRQLRILFSDQGAPGPSFGSNDRFLPFIQMILHGASGLEKLLFSYSQNNTIPSQLQCLTLPANLKSLHLECELTYQQLEGLTASRLVNLRHFGVMISRHTFKDNILWRVLDKFKATLRRLYFHGIKFDQSCILPREQELSYFQFPLMESLKLFSNSSIHGELAYGLPLGTLQMSLPQLKHLWLKHHTKEMFHKWTENSCFHTVTNLGVGLVKSEFPIECLKHDTSIGVLQMELLQRAFPNVTVLNLNVAEKLGGLICLFTGRLRLTELKLVVKKNERSTYTNFWDCLLIGVYPENSAERLVENPQIVSPYIDPRMPSIRQFTVLRSLSLSASFLPALRQDSLISDAVFRFAFLRMPTLNKLHFVGMFKPSRLATRLWQSRHRTITYTAF